MKSALKFFLVALSIALLSGCTSNDGAPAAKSPVTIKEESVVDYKARMAWFAEAQYGLFIHFGLYSQLGGQWKGEPIGFYSEWIQASADIPSDEYAPLIETFNPADFDADLIVRAAKEAGMTYLVITAKHHEGFCLWDSEYTNFDVANSPFAGRDLLQELKTACARYGLQFGIYYSIIDWNHPSQIPNPDATGHWRRWGHTLMTSDAARKDYIRYQTNQVLELIEDYEPTLLWFDGDWVDWWTLEEGVKLYNTIRAADPNIIVNNRVAKRSLFEADFVTQEQKHFDEVFPKYWEGCYTMNKSWGYKKHDDNWKDAETVYNKLKDINEKGGSLLLNVGPDGRGIVQAEAYAILEETAELLKTKPIEKAIPPVDAVPGIVDDAAEVAWDKLLSSRNREKEAFKYIENNPALPNVLIYGDSISIGYTPELRRQLDGEANVYRLHTNGAYSSSVIPKLKKMRSAMRDPLLDAPWTFDWDVVQLNVGLHDLTYRTEDYTRIL